MNYTLRPTDYFIGRVSENSDLCLTWPVALPPDSDGVDWQMGNFFIFLVIDRSTLIFSNVLGTPFLRTVYSIFR